MWPGTLFRGACRVNGSPEASESLSVIFIYLSFHSTGGTQSRRRRPSSIGNIPSSFLGSTRGFITCLQYLTQSLLPSIVRCGVQYKTSSVTCVNKRTCVLRDGSKLLSSRATREFTYHCRLRVVLSFHSELGSKVRSNGNSYSVPNITVTIAILTYAKQGVWQP